METPSDAAEQTQETFVQLLTDAQLPLLHYITTLLGDVHAAQNVLQETNLILWRKSKEYQPGTRFKSWAYRVAYWQVKAYVRNRGRDRHVFDEQLVKQLAQVEAAETVNADARLALRHCLTQVSDSNRELLRLRYDGGQTIQSLSEKVGKTPNTVKVGLLRIRKSLLKCIESRLATE